MNEDLGSGAARLSCVLDGSFTFQWLFEDESSPEGDAGLGAVRACGAVVPAPWFAEIANGLGIAERRGRITAAHVAEALRLLRSLPPTVDPSPSLAGCGPVLELMRAHRLTAYDATYLDLAIRCGLALATRDEKLRRAACARGIALLQVAA